MSTKVLERISHIVRYPEDADDDDDDWLEFEVIDEFLLQGGSGPDFFKCRYKFAWPENDDGGYGGDNSRKTSTKEVEDSKHKLKVEVTVIDELVVAGGKGPSYVKWRYKFRNIPESQRIIRVKEIVVGDRNTSEGDSDESDAAGTIEAEVVLGLTTDRATGPDYEKKKKKLTVNEQEDG